MQRKGGEKWGGRKYGASSMLPAELAAIAFRLPARERAPTQSINYLKIKTGIRGTRSFLIYARSPFSYLLFYPSDPYKAAHPLPSSPGVPAYFKLLNKV
jgi:hypothetical protein